MRLEFPGCSLIPSSIRPNRRMRTRMSGGVAGESGRPLPLCRLPAAGGAKYGAKCCSALFASPGGLCYSNKVSDEQWSLPVAVGPARSEIRKFKILEMREVGSWFVGSYVVRTMCTVEPL
jgi:hypothetical protein